MDDPKQATRVDLDEARGFATEVFICPSCGGNEFRTRDFGPHKSVASCTGECKTCGFRWPRTDDAKVMGLDETAKIILALVSEIETLRAALGRCVLRLETAKTIIQAECDPDEEDVEEETEFINEMRGLL